ncbi:MAG TPA: AMP-binding protein, partial [Terriglobia bacterium]|nr:AMP-binding protein [Terriglobia bacterium]
IMRVSIPSLLEVTSVEALCRSGAKPPSRGLEPSEIAFIQYTSGSTGDPKGVVLTHANVLANVRGIGWSVNFRPDDYVVSWLPLYHDMGLIGSWLFSIYHGAPITVMSPLAFLSRPERWLWAMHDSRGSLCPAPNFSYELCARKIPDEAIEGLDLSRWRVAINAGEAVLPDTLARFAARFKPYGFRAESFVPCYGLAESSVALTFTPMNRAPVIDAIRRDLFEAEGKAEPAGAGENNVLRFVANGRPMPGHEVKLLDDQGRELGERVQGRIFFRGPSRTAGYYRNPKATTAVITADGWMDSGDLGYWANGELYVTGRLKDCIIKSGRNIIPQEIEAAAAEVPGVRKGCVAAFGALDPQTGTERLVVVAETRATASDELKRIEEGIIRTVDSVLGIPPDKVALVAPQSIPKTSSGKIRRTATRALYLEGRLSGRKRPPWMQIARLWLENLGNGFTLFRRKAMAWAHRASRRSYFAALAYLGGTTARVAGGKRASAFIIRVTARCILRWGNHQIRLVGQSEFDRGKPALLIANRAGHLDPLVAAARIPFPFRFADGAVLGELPSPAAFLLRMLVASPLGEHREPPGGTMRQRIERCLKGQLSVVVLPEGPVGAPPARSRFRLDALHAALDTNSPIYPVLFHGTEGLAWPDRKSEARTHSSEIGMDGSSADAARDGQSPRVIIGEAIRPAANSHYDMILLRERIREALAKLSHSTPSLE